ncbi:flagellar filament capping protein FliD [Priestia koreensis]|uniref:flagellar filament capping protein FliD n=1 Tax=Priestia koreensis TaxID=284581 RepID=UPI00203DF773|nr:flagellar filament capping protein FliD [Priestia koreensis]MCM3004559.1 flagellar filament capping protein FliD [Priestia koreensis]
MVTRISGLASGMDIDQMVSDLMKAERVPLDKMKQKKQQLEWQRDDYRSMNSLLLAFRNDTFNMKLSTSYRSRAVSSSNEGKVTATATSAASASSYSISEISQLASAATKISTGKISSATKIDPNQGLFNQKDNFASSTFGWKEGSVESTSITTTSDTKAVSLDLKGKTISDLPNTVVKVNGKQFTVVVGAPASDNEVQVGSDGKLTFLSNVAKGSTVEVGYIANERTDTFTFADEIKEIQLTKSSLAPGGQIQVGSDSYTIENTGKVTFNSAEVGQIDFNTGKITFNSDIPKDTDIKVTYKQNYFSFDLTSHTSKGDVTEKFNIQGSESLNDVLKSLNASGTGINAIYDSFADKVSLTRKETGDFNTSGNEIETTSGFLNDVLKFGGATENGGTNAKFVINGLATERNSNTFEMNGVSFTFKDKIAATDPAVSLSVTNNATDVVENIKKFVEKYNDTIKQIQDKISETKYRDYTPLTDDQRDKLSDKQQEQWEEKAKSGMLRGDTILSGVLNQLRSDLYSSISINGTNSAYKQLSSIGITTTSNYLEGGKLVIDETKLKKAIEENPESVEKLFTNTGTTANDKGLMNRLYDSLGVAMTKIKERAGNSLSTNKQFTMGRTLDTLNSSIDSFKDRLTQVENRYYSQFTAMEKAIQRANQQSAYITQQFSG